MDLLFEYTEELAKDIFDSITDKEVEERSKRYSLRHQSDKQKIKRDIFFGNITEKCISFGLKSAFEGCIIEQIPYNKILKPNFYKHNPDIRMLLKEHVYYFHIKSQEVDTRYPRSWVVQKTHWEIMKRYALENKLTNHYLIGTTINPKERLIEIKVIQNYKLLFEKELFGEMLKKSLQDNKKALYYDGFKEKNVLPIINLSESVLS